MAFEKADKETIAFFESIVPRDARVELKAMFGHKAAFVNGHMFAGTYGRSLVVRLGDADREVLLAKPGATVFEPMPGRPMKDYVRVDAQAWGDVKAWIVRALVFASTLPPKAGKTRAGKTRADRAGAGQAAVKASATKRPTAKAGNGATKKPATRKTPAKKARRAR